MSAAKVAELEIENVPGFVLRDYWIDGRITSEAYIAELERRSKARTSLISAAPDLLSLAYQYRDDLRHPPTQDSRERRLKAIEDVIAKAEGRS